MNDSKVIDLSAWRAERGLGYTGATLFAMATTRWPLRWSSNVLDAICARPSIFDGGLDIQDVAELLDDLQARLSLPLPARKAKG